jgi:hypothetical protein
LVCWKHGMYISMCMRWEHVVYDSMVKSISICICWKLVVYDKNEYMYVCIYRRTCMLCNVCTYVSAFRQKRTIKKRCTCLSCASMCLRICAHTFVHVCTYAQSTRCIRTYIYRTTRAIIWITSNKAFNARDSFVLYACMNPHTYIRTHKHVYAHAGAHNENVTHHVLVCLCVFDCIWTRKRTHTQIKTCIHTQIRF